MNRIGMRLLKNLKVHFIVPYPINIAPGQRFRFEQYTNLLKEQGVKIKFSPFLNHADYKILYNERNTVRKINAVVVGFLKRFLLLPSLIIADYIFLFREATPIGPPIFEWMMVKILRKKIIYDFDDAIWLTDKTGESWFTIQMRWRRKVRKICQWSDKVSCGNAYLCNFAKRYNEHVVLNPTTIDTEKIHNLIRQRSTLSANQREKKITIGWTGSHSTLKYLHSIEPVLQDLEGRYPHLHVCVIANQSPNLNLARLDYVRWTLATEIEDLSIFDIGVMPLPDDEWAKGKCGFKALQYMALQIPTVASPVGVNTKIIHHGINGFLCSTTEDWKEKLEMLILDEALRKSIGRAGRTEVMNHYSVMSNQENFLNLFASTS
jgi:glycosyltransferase involved in cell wall biosynthesis